MFAGRKQSSGGPNSNDAEKVNSNQGLRLSPIRVVVRSVLNILCTGPGEQLDATFLKSTLPDLPNAKFAI